MPRAHAKGTCQLTAVHAGCVPRSHVLRQPFPDPSRRTFRQSHVAAAAVRGRCRAGRCSWRCRPRAPAKQAPAPSVGAGSGVNVVLKTSKNRRDGARCVIARNARLHPDPCSVDRGQPRHGRRVGDSVHCGCLAGARPAAPIARGGRCKARRWRAILAPSGARTAQGPARCGGPRRRCRRFTRAGAAGVSQQEARDRYVRPCRRARPCDSLPGQPGRGSARASRACIARCGKRKRKRPGTMARP